MADAFRALEQFTDRTERGDAMHSEPWYDLVIRELSDLSDPAKEKLAEAAAGALPTPDADAEEPAMPSDPEAAAPTGSHAPHSLTTRVEDRRAS
jgi:hypothetical protein